MRANAASNVRVEGNQISSTRECAIFVEAPDDTQPAYEGAIVLGNTIFDAGEGIKVVNSNPGSRRASVTADLIKNVTAKSFDEWVSSTRNTADRYTRVPNACGIICNADTVVADNAIETCAVAGIVADVRGSWNPFTGRTRDQNCVVARIADNIVKFAPIGIGYNSNDARGFPEIADNIIVRATNGAVTAVNITNLSGVPGLPTNGFGPYVSTSGAPDIGNATTPISDRFSFVRNKVVPATA